MLGVDRGWFAGSVLVVGLFNIVLDYVVAGVENEASVQFALSVLIFDDLVECLSLGILGSHPIIFINHTAIGQYITN